MNITEKEKAVQALIKIIDISKDKSGVDDLRLKINRMEAIARDCLRNTFKTGR